jgi:cholesterol oxidase
VANITSVETAARLASPAEALGDSYDVVIVGSGYGGAITTARLAVANAAAGGKLRIAVLEQSDDR